MPFAYFGAKHGLARYYPPPAYSRIVEPFAGSAGYAVYWATPEHEVFLYDRDPLVIEQWRRLQSISVNDELNTAEAQLMGEQITDPLIYSIGCGLYRVKEGGTAKKSVMMERMWPGIRRRIEAAVPMIRNWTIECRDYSLVSNREATWFVDPPYESAVAGKAGNRYGHKAHDIEYDRLGPWCRSRDGQVIVCEQGDADWLPFSRLKEQRLVGTATRTEMVWTKGPFVFDAAQQAKAASARRWARMKPREDKWSPKRDR